MPIPTQGPKPKAFHCVVAHVFLASSPNGSRSLLSVRPHPSVFENEVGCTANVFYKANGTAGRYPIAEERNRDETMDEKPLAEIKGEKLLWTSTV